MLGTVLRMREHPAPYRRKAIEHFIFPYYAHVCIAYLHSDHSVLLESENNLREPVVSFHHWVVGMEIRFLSLGSKYLIPAGQLISPKAIFRNGSFFVPLCTRTLASEKVLKSPVVGTSSWVVRSSKWIQTVRGCEVWTHVGFMDSEDQRSAFSAYQVSWV